MNLIMWALVALAPLAAHELGHWATARYFGASLSWRFGWGTLTLGGVAIPIPRLLWSVPLTDCPELTAIRRAGFLAEYLLVWIAAIICVAMGGWDARIAAAIVTVITAVHRILYPLYAGKESDLS